jgi:hypothetical protein
MDGKKYSNRPQDLDYVFVWFIGNILPPIYIVVDVLGGLYLCVHQHHRYAGKVGCVFWLPYAWIMSQEAKKWPNIPLQKKFHRGILRGLRNISDTRKTRV